MAKLLFRLNNVEFDEAEEVRALLHDEGYEFYETSAGFFGIALAGIWLVNDKQFEQARALLDEYAVQRAITVKQAIANGDRETLLQRAMQKPLHAVLTVFSIAVVLYFSVWPFVRFVE